MMRNTLLVIAGYIIYVAVAVLTSTDKFSGLYKRHQRGLR